MLDCRGLTVLITGASAGIGRAMSEEFALRGATLVLVARSQDRLEELAAELQSGMGTVCHSVCADLSTSAGVDHLCSSLDGLQIPIDIVVHNAAFSVIGPFHETSWESSERLLYLQTISIQRITKYCLPGILKRKRGGFLFVCSLYSFLPVPFQAVYGASKSFLLSFALGLRGELRKSDIAVTALCPGYTYTEFRTRAGLTEKRSRLAMTAAQVAHAGVMGFSRNTAIVIPGIKNRVFVFVTRLLPAGMLLRLMRRLNHWRGLDHATKSQVESASAD